MLGGLKQPRYSVAFHWALAQFHGTMELFPYTLEDLAFSRASIILQQGEAWWNHLHSLGSLQERIFAFTYLLLAYLLAVVFISFITSAMTRLDAQAFRADMPVRLRFISRFSQVAPHHRCASGSSESAPVVSYRACAASQDSVIFNLRCLLCFLKNQLISRTTGFPGNLPLAFTPTCSLDVRRQLGLNFNMCGVSDPAHCPKGKPL